jgi:hypothetical protein
MEILLSLVGVDPLENKQCRPSPHTDCRDYLVFLPVEIPAKIRTLQTSMPCTNASGHLKKKIRSVKAIFI